MKINNDEIVARARTKSDEAALTAKIKIIRADLLERYGIGIRTEKGLPAFLDCARKPSCGRWVLHEFSKLNRVTVQDEVGITSSGDEVIYICKKCGAERRWGMNAPPEEICRIERQQRRQAMEDRRQERNNEHTAK